MDKYAKNTSTAGCWKHLEYYSLVISVWFLLFGCGLQRNFRAPKGRPCHCFLLLLFFFYITSDISVSSRTRYQCPCFALVTWGQSLKMADTDAVPEQSRPIIRDRARSQRLNLICSLMCPFCCSLMLICRTRSPQHEEGAPRPPTV